MAEWNPALCPIAAASSALALFQFRLVRSVTSTFVAILHCFLFWLGWAPRPERAWGGEGMRCYLRAFLPGFQSQDRNYLASVSTSRHMPEPLISPTGQLSWVGVCLICAWCSCPKTSPRPGHCVGLTKQECLLKLSPVVFTTGARGRSPGGALAHRALHSHGACAPPRGELRKECLLLKPVNELLDV